jgi:iron complex outermembrane receptor protein
MHSSSRYRLLSVALAAAFGTTFVSWSSLASAQDLAQAAMPTFDIAVPAQSLAAALNELSRQTGTQVLASGDLISRLSAPAVSGRLTLQQALDRLLNGSGLSAVREGSAVVIRVASPAPSTTTLPAVLVTAKFETDSAAALQQEGTAADGYRAKTISSVGALGSMSLQDTPFSMSVVPRELIENIQAQSPDDVYKLNASTRTTTPQITSWSPSVSIRGFDGYNTAEDGLRRAYNHAAVLEDKERVEILNGLSGFLYGAASPGGMINYVYKRPTIERLNSVTVGNYGGSQAYVHGDFGGRIDEAGRAGYRLNLVSQDGGTAIDDQKIKRQLVSAAVDWQITDQLLLELNAVYNKYETSGTSAYWYFDGVRHGSAPDAKKLWSQPWVRDEFENTKLMSKLSYQLNDAVTLRGAFMRDNVDRPVQDHTMNSVSTAGSFDQIRIRSGRTKDTFDAGSALADISVNTGAIAHKLTLGYYMYSDKSWGTLSSPNTGWQGPYTLSTPTYVPEPTFPPSVAAPYYAGRVLNGNYLVGDNVTFNDQWSVLVGVNHSNIRSESLTSSGDRSQPDYDKSRNSPSVSLMFKPVPWLTTYASYIEGLEQGGIAPDETSNAGAIQAPMVSRQKEIGVKATVGKMLLTAAVFDIEKAYEFTDDNNVYTQSGRQNHKGIELNASGMLYDKWTLVGGVTALDAKVKGSEFDGNSPTNVAKVIAKVYSEYELPLSGLSLTGGLYYTGKQWADAANTDRLPGVTTADIGMRYATKAAGKPLTLRLNVSNLTNKSYWLNSYYVGAPRSVAFSAQLQF